MEKKRKDINSDIPRIRCVEDPSNQQVTGNYFPFEIDSESSKGFTGFCKANSLTVHSVLVTLLGNSLKSMEKEYPGLKGSFGKIINPIDLRKFDTRLGKSPMPLGCYVSAELTNIPDHFDVSEKKRFLAYASQLCKTVSKANKAPSNLSLYSVMAYVIELNKMKELVKAIGDAAGLSNLARIDDMVISEDDDAVKLVGQYFTVSMLQPFLFISTLSFKGKMFFCVAFDDKWITEDFVVSLSKRLKDSIHDVAVMK